MQTNKHRLLTRCLATVVLTLTLFAGCDTTQLTDSLDNFNVIIGLESVETTVSGQFVDARTGELIEQPITVTFKGPNADDVIDMFSKQLDRQEINGGLISFGMNNNLNPTASSPARVEVVAESNGYIGTGKTVTVNSEGETTFVLFMVDPDNPPDGSTIRTESKGQAGSDGSLQQNVAISSGTEGQSNANTSIKMNQGTVLSGAGGEVLNGNLTTTLGYFNNSSGQSLMSLPGDKVSVDGKSLVTAGFSSVEIRDGDGTETASFSDPITLTTEIPPGTANPKTGQSIKAGDEITVYSYDTENAEWVSEGMATVQGPLPNGNYYVEYQTDHLSYLGLFFPDVPTCSSGASVTINRNGNTGPLDAAITAEGFSKGVTIPAGVSSISIPDDLSLENVPALQATLMIVTESGSVTQTGNLCSGSYNLNLPQPPAEQVDLTVEVTLQCPNPDESIRVTNIPTATVRYRSSNAVAGVSWKTATDLHWDYNDEEGRLEGGNFKVQGVTAGSAYDFKIYFDGDIYDRNGITLTTPTTTYTEEISANNCS